jgi:hypothetical protein
MKRKGDIPALPELDSGKRLKKRIKVPWNIDSSKQIRSGGHIGVSDESEVRPQRTRAGETADFLMIVSPGEGGIAVDAVQTILHSYPESKIWLRDDCTRDGTFERLQNVAEAYPHRIDLIRNPTPMGYKGLPVSVFRSFDRICQSGERLEMVIKLDPDVLLRGDEIVRLARSKFAEEGPGIIGSYLLSAAKTRRDNTSFCIRFLLDLFPAGFDRHNKRLRFGLPFYAKYLLKAFRNGYLLGRHVMGAFYIVHGDTLRALNEAGFWRSIPDLGSREIKWDDALVPIGPYFIGHKLIDLHDQVESRFWIQSKNPISLSAEEIVARRYQAVHPLKDDAAGSEIRARLAELAPHPPVPAGTQ